MLAPLIFVTKTRLTETRFLFAFTDKFNGHSFPLEISNKFYGNCL